MGGERGACPSRPPLAGQAWGGAAPTSQNARSRCPTPHPRVPQHPPPALGRHPTARAAPGRQLGAASMGCGSSTPVKEYGTTAGTHAAARKKDGESKTEFDIGPNYKPIKHLGGAGRPPARPPPPQPRPTAGQAAAARGGGGGGALGVRACPHTHLPLPPPKPRAGRGGTGDTWLFKDLVNSRDVAVKFIKRPLPKVLRENIQREFTVRAWACGRATVGGSSGLARLGERRRRTLQRASGRGTQRARRRAANTARRRGRAHGRPPPLPCCPPLGAADPG